MRQRTGTAGSKRGVGPRRGSHGAYGSEPPAHPDALRRYKDHDQLKPQGDPAEKRPTDPSAIERSDRPDRDTQYGGTDKRKV